MLLARYYVARNLLALTLALFSASCGCLSTQLPSEAEIKQAVELSKQKIQDPNAIMPNWYRRALQPSYTYGELSPRTCAYPATPRVIITPLFVALAFAATWIFICILFVARKEYDPASGAFGGAVLSIPAAFLIGLMLKVAVLLWYDDETYIPWDFATVVGAGILSAIATAAFFVGLLSSVRIAIEKVAQRAWWERLLISIAGGLITSALLYTIGVSEGIKLLSLALIGAIYITISIGSG